MRVLRLLLVLLALALLAPYLSAQVTQFVMTCPFSTTSNSTLFNATYFFQGQLNCSAITTSLQQPNGTTLALSEQACANGIHQYTAFTPSLGVYTAASTDSSNSSASCSFARLRTPAAAPPSVPELPLWLAPPLALLALLLMRRKSYT